MTSRTSPALRRTSFWIAAGAAVLVSALIVIAAEKADVGDLTPRGVTVNAHPISLSAKEPDKRDFGRLTFLGEAVLTSDSDYFGGYSGLVLDAAGERFLAVSDAGSWLSGRIANDGGRLALSETRVGAIPQEDGRPLQKRGDRDAEAIVALSPGALEGRYLVSFEDRHRIEEYAFEQGELRGPLGKRPLPDQLKSMGSNAGLEDVAILRGGEYAGAMVAFAEEKITPEGHHTGAMVLGGKSLPLFMTRHEQYAITDMAGLADGSLVVLERHFNQATRRLGIRLRLIAAAEVKPGAVLAGEPLIEMGPELEIDNFEALTVNAAPGGGTILTLMSDDNFNTFQRTLLLQFKLP